MEKKMENEMETGGEFRELTPGFRGLGFGVKGLWADRV